MRSAINFITALRERSKISQSKLAKELGVTWRVIDKFEKGEIERMELNTLVRIADYFGLVITLSARLEIPEGLESIRGEDSRVRNLNKSIGKDEEEQADEDTYV